MSTLPESAIEGVALYWAGELSWATPGAERQVLLADEPNLVAGAETQGEHDSFNP